MARGLLSADIISTVSPTYAREILSPEFGEGLDGLLRARQDQLVGILNGIDYAVFDPQTDPHIAANYSVDDITGKAACKAALQRECGFVADPARPVIGMVTRLAEQKGLDLVYAALPALSAGRIRFDYLRMPHLATAGPRTRVGCVRVARRGGTSTCAAARPRRW